jgi:hypothetical protein
MGYELYSQYVATLNSSYTGQAERATFTFSLGPEQVDFINNFFASQYINECINAVETDSPGDHVLILQVYRDTSPTWQTDYKLVITSTDVTGNTLPWVAIIGLALIAIAVVYFVVRPTLEAVTTLLYGSSDGSSGSGTSLITYIPWIIAGIVIILLTKK